MIGSVGMGSGCALLKYARYSSYASYTYGIVDDGDCGGFVYE
jgi:hypothetical protein